jgi:hypothetical protein
LPMPWEEYIAAHGLNMTVAETFARKSPFHAWLLSQELKSEKPKEKRKRHFTLGILVHRFVFEPEKALDGIVMMPKDIEEMHSNKTERRDWVKQHQDDYVLTTEDRSEILGLTNAILMHPGARRVFEGGESERAIFADYVHDTAGPIQRKGRIDHIPPGNVLADLKVMRSATKKDMERAIFDYWYHVRIAYYMDMWKALGREEKTVPLLIVVEKEPPYSPNKVRVFQIQQDAIELGRRTYAPILPVWKQCADTDQWPGYGDGIDLISVPHWAFR